MLSPQTTKTSTTKTTMLANGTSVPLTNQTADSLLCSRRGRKHKPALKAPLNLWVGVVKKLRDARGNLLKVTTKALFGRIKDIEPCIQQLGIGQKINTSHLERLNGTLRGQQTRLARRTRNGGSRRTEMLQ